MQCFMWRRSTRAHAQMRYCLHRGGVHGLREPTVRRYVFLFYCWHTDKLYEYFLRILLTKALKHRNVYFAIKMCNFHSIKKLIDLVLLFTFFLNAHFTSRIFNMLKLDNQLPVGQLTNTKQSMFILTHFLS